MSPEPVPDCPLCEIGKLEARAASADAADPFGRARVDFALCSECAFLFASERPSLEELEDHYRHTDPRPRVEARDAAWAERIRGAAEARGVGGRLLEIGCGTGDRLARLDLPGWRLVGIEPSDAAARTARGRGLEVHAGLFEFNQFPSEVFDVVVAVGVLERASDPVTFLGHVERVLAPRGTLLLEAIDPTRLEDDPEGLRPTSMGLFAPTTLHHALARLGIETRTAADERGARLALEAVKTGEEVLVDPVAAPSCAAIREALKRTVRGRAA